MGTYAALAGRAALLCVCAAAGPAAGVWSILSTLSALITPCVCTELSAGRAGGRPSCRRFRRNRWTGFATPRLLQGRNPFKAGLILGLLWATWHVLADFAGNIGAMGMARWLPWIIIYWLLPLTAYRILMTWLYSKTKSLLVAQLMHASYTGWLFVLTPAAPNLGVLWQAIFAASLWGIVALVYVWESVGKQNPSDLRCLHNLVDIVV